MHRFLDPFSRAALAAVMRGLDAVGGGSEVAPSSFTVTAPPKPELGDFAVGLFPAARALKRSPAQIAAGVAEAFAPGDYLTAAKANGPFVNFFAHRPALYDYLLQATLSRGDLIPTAAGTGKTVCIDYSSPNISKQLAYHHIRSTVIGHALVNLYRAAGYRVIGINHLGDWGTTHGMLICAYNTWGAPEPLTIAALGELYVRFRQAAAEDSALEDEARAWFKKLEDGDPEAQKLWQRFRDVSLAEFQEFYDALGIEFEEVKGESDFMPDVPGVLELLAQKNLLCQSDGALVVPAADDDTPPMLLRKKDGATLYGTRDLAAAIHRYQTYGFARSLYVVDRGQALHFRQLFDTLARAGFDWANRCAHVPFGLVRMGGIKTGTRKGNIVLLKEVLAEAERRAIAVVKANRGGEMDESEIAEIARAVGIGAVVFANLVSQREKDIDFEWEQILSTTGDSGPYVQYAHARCASIMRKARQLRGGGLKPSVSADGSRLASEYEWGLARKLIEFGQVVNRAAHQNDPHLVSRYLLDLCTLFSRWYTAGNQDRSLRVLVDDKDLATARLSLVAAIRHVLARGLALLGLEAPEVM